RRTDSRRFLKTFCELTRLMAQFARYEGIESLLITVNPRHVKFYTQYLGFAPISRRIAVCAYVQNRPAVALRLEFDRIDRDRPACWEEYFGHWFAREALRPYTVCPEEMSFLSSMVTAAEILQVSNFVKSEPKNLMSSKTAESFGLHSM
ncbi:MAG TPA: hypothetical protein VGJ16_04540, partial [Pirellulales bacterium]